MSLGIRRTEQRPRQHGATLQPSIRRELERDGWRTTLDYRENHVRGLDGRLLRVEPVWSAEAERYDGQVRVTSACGRSAEEAWHNLAVAIEEGRITTLHRVRVAQR